MDGFLIIARGTILGINMVFGAIYALIVAVSMLAGPFVIFNGGRATSETVVAVFTLLCIPAAGAIWFLVSDHAKSSERLVFLLPAFWTIPFVWKAAFL
jgi:hypothetical protein